MFTSARPLLANADVGYQTQNETPEILDLCIVCDGAVGLAIASLLSTGGHNIRICPINETERTVAAFIERLPLECEIRDRGAAVSTNREKTLFSSVSTDLALSLRGSDGIIICHSVTEYGALADKLAPYMSNGQTVFLCNAPIAAGLQFKQLMRRKRKELQLNIVELGTVFDCARIEGGVLLISGQRDKVSFCGNTRNEMRRGIAIASSISQGLVPTSNLMERGLSDVEKILRPVFLLFSLLGGRANELDNIANLVNPSLTKLIASLDAEIQQLAKVYGVVVPSFLETLTHFGGVGWEDADTLGQALITIAGNLLEQRLCERSSSDMSVQCAVDLLRSGVIETFTLLSEFARLSRMRAPVVNSVIDLASVVTRTDFERSGRKLSDIGLLGFDVHEVVEIING